MRWTALWRMQVCCALVVVPLGLIAAEPQSSVSAAEQRAVAYLSQEVPKWRRENHCFSCHNNGDAARALYVARAQSHAVEPQTLQETSAWLLDPLGWDDAKGEPGFSDRKLARIQFAAALTEALQTGSLSNQDALVRAAERLLDDQEEDGSWDVDVPGVVGSPATYGDALGSYMARRTITTAGPSRFSAALARADAWFLTTKPTATVDVSAVALALADRIAGARQLPAPFRIDAPATKLRGLVEGLIATQNRDGGWGPYPKSPSEPFDTAVAVLALRAFSETDLGDRNTTESAVSQGRDYLIRTQLPAGGWPETTRPSGFQSYAQHISTSAWATLALLKTRDFIK